MKSLKIAILHIRDERPDNPGFQQELDELNASALSEVRHLGHEPLLVPTALRSLEQVQQTVDASDAVLIMGGEDVDPALYNGELEYPGSGQHETDADRAQIAAITQCLATGTPLLGICRGLQLLNVALGGTLIQHMDNAQPHRGTTAEPFVDTHIACAEPALASDLLADEPHRCTHHQAIKTLGSGLHVAARSTDGVIEAVVHESASITAVQWHPEHPATASTQLRALLRRLESQCEPDSASAASALVAPEPVSGIEMLTCV